MNSYESDEIEIRLPFYGSFSNFCLWIWKVRGNLKSSET